MSKEVQEVSLFDMCTTWVRLHDTFVIYPCYMCTCYQSLSFALYGSTHFIFI